MVIIIVVVVVVVVAGAVVAVVVVFVVVAIVDATTIDDIGVVHVETVALNLRSVNIERIKHKDVMIILGQGHNISLRRYFKAAATRNLNMRTFKFRL